MPGRGLRCSLSTPFWEFHIEEWLKGVSIVFDFLLPFGSFRAGEDIGAVVAEVAPLRLSTPFWEFPI